MSEILVEYEKFLTNKRKRSTGDNLLPSTIKAYMSVAERIEESLSHNGDLDKIKEICQKFIDTNTSTNTYSAVRSFLEFKGFDPDKIELKHTVSRTALKSVRMMQTKVLSEDEIISLFDNIPETLEVNDESKRIKYDLTVTKDDIEIILLLTYWGALRRQELCNIKVCDIDFINNEIIITGKGDKKAIIPYPSEVIEKVKTYKNIKGRNNKDAVISFDFEGNSGELKHYKKPTRIVWAIIKILGENILNKDVTPHFMRHSRATHMTDRGADILSVRALLRHEQVKTTEIYAQVSKAKIRDAYEKFGRYDLGDLRRR